MNVLLLFIFVVIQSCHVLSLKNQPEKISEEEEPRIEPFSSISELDEKTSVASEVKRPKNNHVKMATRRYAGEKKLGKNSHHLKINGGINDSGFQSHGISPVSDVSGQERTSKDKNSSNHKKFKSEQKQTSKKKKKVQKRYFSRHDRNYNKVRQFQAESTLDYEHRQTYNYFAATTVPTIIKGDEGENKKHRFPTPPRNSAQEISTFDDLNDFPQDSTGNLWDTYDQPTADEFPTGMKNFKRRERSSTPTSSTFQDDRNYDSSQYHSNLRHRPHSNRPLVKSMRSKFENFIPPTDTMTSEPPGTDLAATSDRLQHREKAEVGDWPDDSESDDTSTVVDYDTTPWEVSDYATADEFTRRIQTAKPNDESSTIDRPDTSNLKRDKFPNSQYYQISDNSPNQDNVPIKSPESKIKPHVHTPVFDLPKTAPPTLSTALYQADIIQRNLEIPPERRKHDGKARGSDTSDGESESDDTEIAFDGTCDEIQNHTCWIQREVGDVLTLALKISSSKKPSSLQIRWMKVLHNFDTGKGKAIEIEPGKLPWSMVSGSEGRELRLNPVTNTDTDPNSFVAKVFHLTKNKGKVLFTLLKELIFRIDIPIIDMGKLYAGEEISINMENFISLPERGNLLFYWSLEIKPHEYVALPSNIKVSNSGRSVVLKELKKGRLGVLNCMIYSSNRYALAKRRFNILKIADSVKRRSTIINFKDDESLRDLVRSRRCRHIFQRNQEKARRRLEEERSPKHRKKRFKRMNLESRELADIDCEPLRRKVYSRRHRSLLKEFNVEDPGRLPLKNAFELSTQGDSTLDDLFSGTFSQSSTANCSIDADCNKNEVCVSLDDQTNHTVKVGSCQCRPGFLGDGLTCREIPMENYTGKRQKRNSQDDFHLPHHLFYESPREVKRPAPEAAMEQDFTEPPKVLAFEEEESFLLTDCIDDKDCSIHADCIQATNGHPYCKCRPGFRGNGIFCWETIDYVPPEEQFLADDETVSTGMNPMPELSENEEVREEEE